MLFRSLLGINLLKMYSRMPAMNRRRAVWLINQDVTPQLDQMYLTSTLDVPPNFFSYGPDGVVRMKGKEVFRHAVVNLASVLRETMDVAGLTPDQIDWLVPHQANKRIIESNAAEASRTLAKLHAGTPEQREEIKAEQAFAAIPRTIVPGAKLKAHVRHLRRCDPGGRQGRIPGNRR